MDYSVRSMNLEAAIIDIFTLTMYQMTVKQYKEVTDSDEPSDNHHINLTPPLLELHSFSSLFSSLAATLP